MKRVFISYSHEDEALAQQLKQELGDYGMEAWIASDEIRPGDRVADHIRESLALANAVVLLIGREPSTWARYEWSQALEMSWDEGLHLPVVPVVLHDTDPPSFLRHTQFVRVSDPARDWEQVARVLKAAPTLDSKSPDDASGDLAQRLLELREDGRRDSG